MKNISDYRCRVCRDPFDESDGLPAALFGSEPDICRECWKKIPEADRYRLTREYTPHQYGGLGIMELLRELLNRIKKEAWFADIITNINRN